MMCDFRHNSAIMVCASPVVVKTLTASKMPLVSVESVRILVHKHHAEGTLFAEYPNIGQFAYVQMATKGNPARNVVKWSVPGMMIVAHCKCVSREVARIPVYSLVLVARMLNVELSTDELNVHVLWVTSEMLV